MAQVEERRAPAPLSPGDRRLFAATGAGLTAFAGLVACLLATASQRPALGIGTVVATLLVTVVASRWRREDTSGGLHRDDPRGFKSRKERQFWGDA